MARSPARRLLASGPLRRLYRAVLVPENDASWIFDAEHLAWTAEAPLRDQLPPTYRALCRLYAAQTKLRGGTVLGGQMAFGLARWIHARVGQGDDARMDLGAHTTHLHLADMRMLQVPNEIRTTDGDAAVVERCLRPGDSFVDVGANHGSFSIRASAVVGEEGMVVAVEPQPWLAELVERSLEVNACSPYRVLRQACGEREGTVTLVVPRTSSGSASVHDGHLMSGEHIHTVAPLRRLDESIAWRELPGEVLLKIDVEGAELSVLRGASEFLHERRPRVVMEINPVSLDSAGVSLDGCLGFLREHGYDRFADPLYPESTRPLAELSGETHRNVLLLPSSRNGEA